MSGEVGRQCGSVPEMASRGSVPERFARPRTSSSSEAATLRNRLIGVLSGRRPLLGMLGAATPV